MQTDLDVWLDVVERFGLEPRSSYNTRVEDDTGSALSYEMFAGDAKVSGYSGNSQTWEFDRNGKFIETGCWG